MLPGRRIAHLEATESASGYIAATTPGSAKVRRQSRPRAEFELEVLKPAPMHSQGTYSTMLPTTSRSLTGGLRNGIHCTFCQCLCPTKSVDGTVAATITADQTPNPIHARGLEER